MAEHDPLTESRRFGRYLRRVREERKLSLDSVEEMTLGYPERITKSHLSRIENGQAVPTFPRMFALSQIYGVPISSLAERFEIDLKYQLVPAEVSSQSDKEILQNCTELRSSGAYSECLQLCEFLLDRWSDQDADGESLHEKLVDLRLLRVACLIHLDRFILAKDECENLLSVELTPEQQAFAVQTFSVCCYRLGKYTMALMAIERAKQEIAEAGLSDNVVAHLATIEGNLLAITGQVEKAINAYKNALEKYEKLGIRHEVCRVRLNLCSALIELGKYKHARRNLVEALQEAEAGGFQRQAALAISNLGLVAYREGSLQMAESQFLRSNSIARPREYLTVVYRNCYYLWRIAQVKGDQPGVRVHERTLRTYLSRVESHLPEVEKYRAHLRGGEES